MRIITIALILTTALIIGLIASTLISCSKSLNAVVPDGTNQSSIVQGNNAENRTFGKDAENRFLYGYWQFYIPEDRSKVEAVPLRTADLHLNVVKLIEGKACNNCLKIGNFFVTSNNRLFIDVTLTHPFPGLIRYSGFDVRAVVITEANYDFPGSARKINWNGNLTLYWPDGYTNLYNPTEFPSSSDKPPALKYIPGKFSTGGDLSSTLNPYICFRKEEPRRVFLSTDTETKTMSFQLTSGPIQFGYAVDACWTPVAGTITDPVEDFPISANCREAYAIFGTQGSGLKPIAGTSTPFQVEIWDHQGTDTISTVTIEAPELFNGVESLAVSTLTDEGILYTGTLVNEKGAPIGDYPVLIRVTDWGSDENFSIVDAWQVSLVKVTKLGYPINELIDIPAGEFFMGIDPANDPYYPFEWGPWSDYHAVPGHMHPTEAYYWQIRDNI
jgi:hypothetical protein